MAREAELAAAVEHAVREQPRWDAWGAADRALCLERTADRLEADRTRWIALLGREAGKTLPDAVAELREAIDFCRYDASQARILFSQPVRLPGPSGESNRLALHSRGVFVCISPWNFPLAIFVGQIAAALAAGNTVLAKPAAAGGSAELLALDPRHPRGR